MISSVDPVGGRRFGNPNVRDTTARRRQPFPIPEQTPNDFQHGSLCSAQWGN